MNRLNELQAHYGEALQEEARKEQAARTRGGDRSYGRFGSDIITTDEIVSTVFVRWAEDERVTVEWLRSLEGDDATGKMLRRYCINAASDVLQANIEYRRIEGAHVEGYGTSTAATVEGEDGSDWLLNTQRFSVASAEDEALRDRRADLMMEVWEGIAHDIIDAVSHEGMREALRLYVFKGMQHRDIAERLGINIETSKKAYARGVKDEEAIACLVVVRNLRFKGEEGTGRAPALPKALPTRLLEASGVEIG